MCTSHNRIDSAMNTSCIAPSVVVFSVNGPPINGRQTDAARVRLWNHASNDFRRSASCRAAEFDYPLGKLGALFLVSIVFSTPALEASDAVGKDSELSTHEHLR